MQIDLYIVLYKQYKNWCYIENLFLFYSTVQVSSYNSLHVYLHYMHYYCELF